ncbi:MAG: DUF2203 domain-containing protein [Planctomycetota bacterium]
MSDTPRARLFTPAEANTLLPKIKPIVAHILAKAGEARSLMALGSSVAREARVEGLEVEVRTAIESIEEMGCQFKDWNFQLGLVDFPARINGQDVLLCWRSDEPSVAHYHTHDGGYAGRKPIQG